jgi:hypothetical protein
MKPATHLIPKMRVQTTRGSDGGWNSATYDGQLRWFWVRAIDDAPHYFLTKQQIIEAYEIASSHDPPMERGWFKIGAFVDD